MSNQDIPKDTRESWVIWIVTLLRRLVAAAEYNGTAGITQQRALLKGELISRIKITNTVNKMKSIGKRFEISLFSNRTLFDLKNLIGVMTEIPPEYVAIVRDKIEFKQEDNGKTLGDLGFKPEEKIEIEKQPP